MKQQFMKLRDKGKFHLIVINDSCLHLTSESFESIEVDEQADVSEIFLVYHESWYFQNSTWQQKESERGLKSIG
jgi:hypothetical protein